jgi:hypothetical protein
LNRRRSISRSTPADPLARRAGPGRRVGPPAARSPAPVPYVLVVASLVFIAVILTLAVSVDPDPPRLRGAEAVTREAPPVKLARGACLRAGSPPLPRAPAGLKTNARALPPWFFLVLHASPSAGAAPRPPRHPIGGQCAAPGTVPRYFFTQRQVELHRPLSTNA